MTYTGSDSKEWWEATLRQCQLHRQHVNWMSYLPCRKPVLPPVSKYSVRLQYHYGLLGLASGL
jgi:hypothetical protein